MTKEGRPTRTYPATTIPTNRYSAAMYRLGFPQTPTTQPIVYVDPLENVTGKAVLAAWQVVHDFYTDPRSGARKVKVREHKAAEVVAYQTVCEILADWPGQPYGDSTFKVRTTITEALSRSALAPKPDPHLRSVR